MANMPDAQQANLVVHLVCGGLQRGLEGRDVLIVAVGLFGLRFRIHNYFFIYQYYK